MEIKSKDMEIRFAMSFLPRNKSLKSFYEAYQYGNSNDGWKKSDGFFKKLQQEMGYIAFHNQRYVIGHWGSPEPSIITSTQYNLNQIGINFVAQRWINEFDQDAVVCLMPKERALGGLFSLSFDSLDYNCESFEIMNSFYKRLAISYEKDISKKFPENHLGFSLLLWDKIEYWFENYDVGRAMFDAMLKVAKDINLKINEPIIFLGYKFLTIERII